MAAAPPPVAQRTSGMAIASIVLSGLAFVMMGPFASIPGVVCGHLARRECRRDPTLKGQELALAGMILGYVNLAFTAIAFVVVLAVIILMVGFAAVAHDSAPPSLLEPTPPSTVPLPEPVRPEPGLRYSSAGPPSAMGTWMRVVRSAAKACLRAAPSRSGSSALTPMAPQASAIWA